MSHLFNVAHTLRMMVQKERSLDILKVGEGCGFQPLLPYGPLEGWGAAQWAVGLPGAAIWSLHVYVCRLHCQQVSALEGPFHLDQHPPSSDPTYGVI